MTFEWDDRKAKSNLVKHDVSFEEAATIFGDPLSLTIPDPLHSREEFRFVTVGVSSRFRTLIVVRADRGDNIRIISARIAPKRERRDYEKGV